MQIIIKEEKNLPEILKSCGKTKKDIENCLEIIREWYIQQLDLPILPEEYFTELFFIQLLFNCKFNLVKVKQVISTNYRIRNYVPEVFSNWDPLNAETQKILQVCSFVLMPKLTPDLRRVQITRFLDKNPENFNPWEFYKVVIMFGHVLGPRHYVNGEQMILDATGLTLGHVLKCNPFMLKKMYDTLMKGYAVRISGIHFLYSSAHLNTLIALLRPIVKAKIMNRIHFHSNLESLYKYVPKEYLPEEYGGDQLSLVELYASQIKELNNSTDLLMNELQYKANENKPLNNSDEMVGTFKKLDID